MAMIDQPLRTLVQADAGEARLSPIEEAVVVRVATMVYELVQRASPAAVMTAAASGSNAALVGALADLVGAEAASPDPIAAARLRGQVAVATRLTESGGVWGADEAIDQLRVTRSTLQNWRTARRVIALERDDGSFAYPVAQFEPPRSDLQAPRPYPAMATIGACAKDALSAEELVVLLATPHERLGTGTRAARTGFEALADGDASLVIDLVADVARPADADAPSRNGAQRRAS